MSHPRPPAQPFSCLPSPLAASQPPYSAPGPLGEPSRHRAPSLTRGGPGWGGRRFPFPGGPLRSTSLAPRHQRIPPEGCCGRAGPSAPPPTGSGLGPPAQTRSGSALASPPPPPNRKPPPAAGWVPGGVFQVGPSPCPHTRTHARRPPNDRQGLEKGWGVFTVPRAASAGPDAAPGRSPPPPAPPPPHPAGHPRPQRGGRGGVGSRPGGN